MTLHDYTPDQALKLLLSKLDAANEELAQQVRRAIDAGKDIEQAEPGSSRRKKVRRYRKSVRLSTEEALAAAANVLQAYFVEQPLLVASALDNVRSARTAGPRKVFDPMRIDRAAPDPDDGSEREKNLEIELRAETQLTSDGEETHRLLRPNAEELKEQSANLEHLRALLRFGLE